MLKEYKFIGMVFLPVIILLMWVTTVVFERNMGREVIVRISGYDPRDLLSGHYINYTLDWLRTDCKQFKHDICPVDEFDTVGRFYVAQDKAQALDRDIQDRNNTAELVFSYKEGIKPYVIRLLLNGQEWGAVEGN